MNDEHTPLYDEVSGVDWGKPRRGIDAPEWLLLLVIVLGILSPCLLLVLANVL